MECAQNPQDHGAAGIARARRAGAGHRRADGRARLVAAARGGAGPGPGLAARLAALVCPVCGRGRAGPREHAAARVTPRMERIRIGGGLYQHLAGPAAGRTGARAAAGQ